MIGARKARHFTGSPAVAAQTEKESYDVSTRESIREFHIGE
jgi:hypothetical protein